MEKVLLDTNVVIALIGGEPKVIARIEACTAVFMPAIVLGELFFGAFRSSRQQQNLTALDVAQSRMAVLNCDNLTARFYGQLKAQLMDAGRPIPENDVWIAAVARQHDCVLLTRDAHFRNLPEVKTEMV
jgi:tRNA(fMet)-specific endonuclease VapC